VLAPAVGAAAFLLTPVSALAADHDSEGKSGRSANREADHDGEGKGGRSANREADPAAREPRKSGRTGDDLESCRRDADGMRGPERSRFMTQCLKDRK
jgi:hypothetical protein